MSITRADLYAAARRFNRDQEDGHLHADVLAGESQLASTLTVYRRVGLGSFERLARWELHRDGDEAMTPVEGYGTPTPDEQVAIDALAAGIGKE